MHRGVHELSGLATDAYEGAREKIRVFFNAVERAGDRLHAERHRGHQPRRLRVRAADARGGRRGRDLGDGAPLEHRALAARVRGARRAACAWRRSTITGALILEELDRLIGPRTRIVSIAHMSNALGTINPVEEIVALAHARGVPVLIDGSQAAYHMPVDVQAIGCDFYVATGHKLYGPTGIGVLVGKAERLEAMPPFLGGGDMIRSVTFERSTWNDLPYKFEAGTPNIAGAIGLGAAIDYIQNVGREAIAAHEQRAAAVRHGAARGDPGRAHHRDGARTSRAFSRSSWTACIRTTSERSSIAKAWRCAPGITAPSRSWIDSAFRRRHAPRWRCTTRREDLDALGRALEKVREVFS